MEIKTIFQVNNHNGTNPDTYEVTATGQEAANAIVLNKGQTKVLKGFNVNGKFIKTDLSSQYNAHGFSKGK